MKRDLIIAILILMSIIIIICSGYSAMNLIGMWKFLSGGPRILPTFTRSFFFLVGSAWGMGTRLTVAIGHFIHSARGVVNFEACIKLIIISVPIII